MCRLVKKSKLKRFIISSLLVFMLTPLFSSFSMQEASAASSANAIQQAYIAMMKGATTTDANVMSLASLDDLRLLSLFLSNAYVPFLSCLDGANVEDSQQAQIDFLTNLGFDKDTAKQVVSQAYTATLNSASKLYIKVEDTPTSVYLHQIDNTNTGSKSDYSVKKRLSGFVLDDRYLYITSQTYKNSLYGTMVGEVLIDDTSTEYTPFTMFMLWTFIKSNSLYSSSPLVKYDLDPTSVASFSVPFKRSLTLYRNDNGTMRQCGVLDDDTMSLLTMALSRSSMYKNSEGIPMGNSFLMNTPIDGVISKGGTADEFSLKSNCILFQNIYVDWVGNIFADYGSSRRIIVPACINKATFNNILSNEDSGELYLRKLNGVSYHVQSYFGTAKTKDALSQIDNYGNFYLYGSKFLGESLDDFKLFLDSSAEELTWDNDRRWFSDDSNTAGTLATELSRYGVVTSPGRNVLNNDLGFNYLGSGIDKSLWLSYVHIIYDPYSSHTSSNDLLYIFDAFDMHSMNIDKENGGDNRVQSYSYASSDFYNTFLVYKDIAVSSDNTSTSFVKGNMFDDSVLGKVFMSSSIPSFSDASAHLKLITVNNTSDLEMLRSIYLTYIYAYCNSKAVNVEYNESEHVINMRFCAEVFPEIQGNIVWETAEELDTKVLSMIYYILHPTEGGAYVATLIKNKLTSIILNQHEDMVGSTDSNYTTGMTQYLGYSGYATIPNINDIGWMAKLFSSYGTIIVFLLIAMAVVLLCYVLVGNITLTRGIVGLVIFGVFAFAPPVAISASVGTANRLAETIYSSKFDYWAINQTQGYLEDIASLESLDLSQAGAEQDYVAYLLFRSVGSSGEGGEAITSYSGVKVKWMSPKKVSETGKLFSEIDNRINSSNSGLTTFTSMVMSNMAKGAGAKEIYVASDSATYLYRDFMDIYRCAMASYGISDTFTYKGMTNGIPAYDGKYYHSIRESYSGVPTYYWGATMKFDDTTDTVKNVRNIVTANGYPLCMYVDANSRASTRLLPTESYTFKSFYGDVFGDSDIPTAVLDTSSLNAIYRGFLYNTTGNLEEDLSNSNYYSTNTLATTLLMSNHVIIDYTARKRDNLLKAVEKDEIEFTKEKLSGLSGGLYFGVVNSRFTLSVDDLIKDGTNTDTPNSEKLGGLYYSLYSESPFYFMNYNVRDQLRRGTDYTYSYSSPNASNGNFMKLVLSNNQDYFFNNSEYAGNGYGELRDFMNMHDFFYYIVPSLKVGNDLVNLFDQYWGMEYDPDVKLTFDAEGNFIYQLEDGTVCRKLADLAPAFDRMTEEEKYEFWKNFNVRVIFNCYTPWLNMMYACDYADAQEINIMGKPYVVKDPLDPTSYFTVGDDGNLSDGRYMVFSRSEMAYYGLTWEDLTTVEQKIITVQDNVYNNSIDLMNYYTYSDETLLQAYSMMQLFEFNKEFSQTSFISDDYILYPQGYELKAFTYDAYLRMIVANSGGDSLQYTNAGSGTNESIYGRVMKKTSLFFGGLLLANDVVSVYIIPAFKLFFVCFIFLLSIMLVIASAVKMEFNILNLAWKSLVAPLISFCAISVGLSFVVSLFMTDGADGVTSTGKTTISLGDPTMTISVMLVLNVVAVVLYFRISKKLLKDFVTYTKVTLNNIGSTVSGAFGKILAVATAGKVTRGIKGIRKSIKKQGVASTAEQRGRDNDPLRGRNSAVAGAVAGAAMGAGMSSASRYKNDVSEDTLKAMNKYDRVAFDKHNNKMNMYTDKGADLNDKAKLLRERANNGVASDFNNWRASQLDKKADRMVNRGIRAQEKRDDIVKFGRIGAVQKRFSKRAKSVGSKISSGANKVVAGSKKAWGATKAQSKKALDATKVKAKSFGSNVKIARKKVGGAVKDSYSFIKSGGLGIAAGKALNTADNAVSNVNKFRQNAKVFTRNQVSKVGKGVQSVGKKSLEGVKNTGRFVIKTKDSTVSAVKAAPGKIKELKKGTPNFRQGMQRLRQNTVDGLNSFGASVGKTAGKAGKAVGNAGRTLGTNVSNTAIKARTAVTSSVNKAADGVRQAKTAVRNEAVTLWENNANGFRGARRNPNARFEQLVQQS